MLDEIVHGDAGRLSPDAPVPVLKAEREERSAGGAAHVARCLTALGGEVVCCGVVGADQAASHLRDCLAESGVDTVGLLEDAGRPTTVKRSLVGLAQRSSSTEDVPAGHRILPSTGFGHRAIAAVIHRIEDGRNRRGLHRGLQQGRLHASNLPSGHRGGQCCWCGCHRRSGVARGLLQVPLGDIDHAQSNRSRTGYRRRILLTG